MRKENENLSLSTLRARLRIAIVIERAIKKRSRELSNREKSNIANNLITPTLFSQIVSRD